VPINFLSDLISTTSPAAAPGSSDPQLPCRELVGLAFDGNYSPMASDYGKLLCPT
jgi:hypothetical protein